MAWSCQRAKAYSKVPLPITAPYSRTDFMAVGGCFI